MTNEEAIKRLNELDNIYNQLTYEDKEAIDKGIEALENEKTGHWIDDKCSVCGKGIEDLIDSYEWYRNEKPNFCPFCGAVRLLEQQPCEDAISRQAVIDVVNNPLNIRLDEIIKKLPPVTPQPKMGRWIGHREHCENLGVMPSGLGAYNWCSNCDCGIDVKEWYRTNYNYCPNCGAKMIESEE